jgi:hypothetical protein
VRIWGSPWQPAFYDWAFNLDRGDHIAQYWQRIPAGTDILVTHGPPIGHGDECYDGNRAGCVDLLREIQVRQQTTRKKKKKKKVKGERRLNGKGEKGEGNEETNLMQGCKNFHGDLLKRSKRWKEKIH